MSQYKYTRRWSVKHPKHTLLYNVRTRAKKLNIECNLTVEDINFPTHCPVLGTPLCYTNIKRQDNSPSLDRINPDGGYTQDNIVVISWKANRLKSNADWKELLKIGQFYETLTESTARKR